MCECASLKADSHFPNVLGQIQFQDTARNPSQTKYTQSTHEGHGQTQALLAANSPVRTTARSKQPTPRRGIRSCLLLPWLCWEGSGLGGCLAGCLLMGLHPAGMSAHGRPPWKDLCSWASVLLGATPATPHGGCSPSTLLSNSQKQPANEQPTF